MRYTMRPTPFPFAVSIMALMVAGPAMAQDEVQILSDWTYVFHPG